MDRHANDLNADYYAAGFGGRLRPGATPALILIDFARAYFDRECGLYAGVEAERAVAAQLADAARAARVPVVFTRVQYRTPADGGQFYRKVPALRAFDSGNPMGDFTAELAPQGGDIGPEKRAGIVFGDDDVAATLHALAVVQRSASSTCVSGSPGRTGRRRFSPTTCSIAAI